jgi:predicted ATPase/DNA-binding SARP family transcriptional activator
MVVVHTFAVLGSLEVSRDGTPVRVGGPLPRRMLTALILAAGRPVTDDRLAEVVWADEPPADPGRTLQVYASRLRRALGAGTLVRTPAGYRLEIAPGGTDVERFAALVASGRSLAAAGHPARARRAFEEALRLWRGDPFPELPATDDPAAARAGLIEQRAAVQEESAAARLAAGDAAGAVADLDPLVRAEPYRERRWALLVLALYRDGRQAAALEALRRVRALLADELGVEPGAELRRLEQRVRGHAPDLSSGHRRQRISRPLSSFLGRDHDLALLADLIEAGRLVTVIGPAGAGKTRIAIEYAARRPGHQPAYLVRLAEITDPALLPSVVATAAGIRDVSGDVLASLARRLHPGDLLVLDNCEHLPREAARLACDLLDLVPGLRVLATSRVPLGADGEQALPLGPLRHEAAVGLLVDRIRAVRPAWRPGPADRDTLERIAATLDRLPLALELAAAQTRAVGLRELYDRLRDRFALLGRVPGDRLNPHATLRDAIAWSVGLLAAGERELLLRLWPYENGFPLDAVGDSGWETLTSLVAQSVVEADTTSEPARYRLLETVRAYCRAIDPDPASTRERHAEWVRETAGRAAAGLRGNRSTASMPVLTAELPNIRAALAHDLTAAPAHAVRLAGELMWFWIRSGLLREGQDVLGAALRAAPEAPRPDVVRARTALACLAYVSGEGRAARALLAAAVRDRDAEDHPALYAEVRYYQALAQLPDGDPVLALIAASDACRLAAETGTRWLIPAARTARGAALLLAGRAADGRRDLRAAAGGAADHEWAASLSRLILAQSLVAEDRPAEALPLLGDALARFRSEDDVSSVLAVLHDGALAFDAMGRRDDAALLRAAVHGRLVAYDIRPGRTYIGAALPDGWYAGPPPVDPPSLEAAAALLAAAS